MVKFAYLTSSGLISNVALQ